MYQETKSLEWGVLRNGSVSILGVNYISPIPNRKNVIENINKILTIKNIAERAIRYFLWGMRSQLFWDGNKRISTLAANKKLLGENILNCLFLQIAMKST